VVFDPARTLTFLSVERLLVPVLAGHDVQSAIPVNVGYSHALTAPEVNRLLAERNFVRSRSVQSRDIPPKASRADEGNAIPPLARTRILLKEEDGTAGPFPI
jgi:hypothetical protein